MRSRSNQHIIYSPIQDMGDIQVRQPVPSNTLDYLDPFILLHHAHIIFDAHETLSRAGVGPHPHQGFSPVTFVFKGGSHHRDSRGNQQQVLAGGTQWMHAGMGIIHSERPVEHEMEILQLWINSPARNKMDQPFYRPLSRQDTPQVKSPDGLIEVNIVTGKLLEVEGPIPTMTPINSAMLDIKSSGRIDIPFPVSHNGFIYLLDGQLKVNGKEVSGMHMVTFGHDGEGITLEGMEDTRALFMSGEPIGEEIITHGPFVMNNQTQIMEAFRDYRMGKMGVLIED